MTPIEPTADPVELPVVAGDAGVVSLSRALRGHQDTSLVFDPGSDFVEEWPSGELVAIDPRPFRFPSAATLGDALGRLETRLLERRRRGGTCQTGIALLLAYEAARPSPLNEDPLLARLPAFVALEVDRSVRFDDAGPPILVAGAAGERDRELDRIVRILEEPTGRRPTAARALERASTSLPRSRYLAAVREAQTRIAEGEIYQANLCQQFRVACEGDRFEFWAAQAARTPAPRAAWFEAGPLALASFSPEVFLDQETDRIETRPIKGTRPRGVTPGQDAAARDDLLGSAKDRAELVMIVDLERNDLGRVCSTGTVETLAIHEPRAFPTVHHLVGHVRGRLRPGVGLASIVAATFPGGSITGAPKLRAIKILEGLEPWPRSFFTGSLFWLADDGTMSSSILIRTVIFAGRNAVIGAGGGIVSDSDAEAEWHESNHKVRALTRALGFDPAEVS